MVFYHDFLRSQVNCHGFFIPWKNGGNEMNEDFFRRSMNSYQIFTQECERINQKFDNQIRFCVLQCKKQFQNLKSLMNIVDQISNFYNQNWLGNADYIHIPDNETILENYMKYPIILAYQEIDGFIDILGVATVKYYQNSSQFVNPYYPIPNRNYFEVTGILVKQNSGIKNIGKHIYEIILEALSKYKVFLPDFDVIFVADCRNYMSINGAKGGAKYLRDTIDAKISANLVGYYTLTRDNELVEAPTFVIKFYFENTHLMTEPILFEFQNSEQLFLSLLKDIECHLQRKGIKKGIHHFDGQDLITFYELEKKDINIDDIIIKPNGTELGNDRVPFNTPRRVRFYE